jgi:hypothetical protein
MLMNVVLCAQNVTVNTFNGALHEAGNTITETFTFPDDNLMYASILMHISLDCPPGGCDPWDRFASIQLTHNGEDYEIGRYVTPYGNDWCDWTIDVTDYRTFLKGDVTLKSYVETWSNGWLVNVDFEFVEGVPTWSYVQVQNLILDYSVIYGDTLVAPLQASLPPININIPEWTFESKLRIVNTGHGQGNTDNAAEFAPKTHQIQLNGQTTHEHFLWKSDCAANPCSPQGGTWQGNRAGWCPGQAVTPSDFDITDLVTGGQSATVQYLLEPYYNECSPWNVNPYTLEQLCTSAICVAETSFNSDCNYNGGNHTQPIYKIAIQLINYSSLPFTDVQPPIYPLDYLVQVSPNPTQGDVQVFADNMHHNVQLTVYHINGQALHSETLSAGMLNGHTIVLSNYKSGIYFVTFSTPAHNKTLVHKIIKN